MVKGGISWFRSLNSRERGAVSIFVAIILLYFISCSRVGGDFVTYLEAAVKMRNGLNIYAPPYINLRYSYSPFWAMVLVPLSYLPTSVASFIWLILSLILLVRTVVILRVEFGINFQDQKLNAILWFSILLFLSRFIELNFHHVQMTIFLLWCIMETAVLLEKERDISAGLLIGMGTMIKIMPVVMIPYLLYRARFKAALLAILTSLACFFVPYVVVGGTMFWELNKSWFSIVRPDSPDFNMDNIDHSPHNLSALINRLIMNTRAPYMPNVLSLSESSAAKVVMGVILFFIVFTIYFLGTRPFVSASNKKHTLYELSYITLLIPLIFPHQQKYGFYMLLPAVAYISYTLIDDYVSKVTSTRFKVSAVLFFTSFLLCTATTDLLLGMPLSEVTQYLKTITFGSLILIFILAINRGRISPDRA